MADIASFVPGGIYASIASAMWFACKETDTIIRQDVKERISKFVSNNSAERESIALYNKMFALMYRSFFGSGPNSLSFWLRSLVVSTIWLFAMYYFYLSNIKAPFFIRYTWNILPEYIQDWTGIIGYVYFDESHKYMMPLITLITFSVVCPYGCDTVSLALVYSILKKISNVKGFLYSLLHLAVILVLPLTISFLGVVFSLFMALVYAGKWSDLGLNGLIDFVGETYHNVLSFPGGVPPYKADLAIPVLSVLSVISWSVIFTLSVVLLKLLSSSKFLNVISYFNLKEKPFEAIGWVMILLFSPMFWIFSYFH